MQWAFLMLSILVCAPLPALGAGQDYPTLGHIKGYHIHSYSERPFDAATFEAAPAIRESVHNLGWTDRPVR